jgi:hypothetical protein
MEDLELQTGFPKYNVLFSNKPESVRFLESFLASNSGIRVHPNHYVLQEVKLRLVKQYALRVTESTRVELENFLKTCEELLQTSELIIPGFSEYRGKWVDIN